MQEIKGKSSKKGDKKFKIFLHFQRKHVEYFDSLGKEPVQSIYNLLTSNVFVYKYNKIRLQSPYTESCGLFCFYYSYNSCRKIDYNIILSNFNK